MTDFAPIAGQVETALGEVLAAGRVRAGGTVVIGVSTSEVQGKHIGTSGAEEIASRIHEGVEKAATLAGVHVLWQCCEHLNRALVTERSVAEAKGWTIVSAVPVPKAGGSMSAYAYRRLEDPCLVESAAADAGLDIGETLIGMHLRAVAVPFRPTVRWIGEARVTAAFSRPKLIGGARAVYELSAAPPSNVCE